MSDALPAGWATAKLNDVVRFALGGDWGKDREEFDDGLAKVRVVRGTEFKTWREDKGTTAAERCIKISSLEKRQLQTGDLVLEVSGGGPHQPVGRTVLIDEEALNRADAPLVCSNFFRLLRLQPEIDARFVSRFLGYAYARGAFNEFQTETTNLRNLNVTDFLQETEVPLAPLPEQRRIVAKLETLLGKVDACQRRLAKIPRLLKRFRQSVLAAACSGRLTADWREQHAPDGTEEWRELELRDICTSITDGDHLPPPQQPSGIPFLTIGNISSGRLNFSNTRFVGEDYYGRIKADRRPAPGDVLYTVVGATIGIPVMVDTDRPFCFQRHIAILKPSSATTSAFLYLLMSAPPTFREAWARVTGSAQPTLPLGNLRPIPVSLPPLPEQQEIVRRVDQLFTFADQLEARFAKSQAHVDKLTQSLLAKAFRGELVPQDPNDEPASALLARIRSEPNGEEKPTRSKTRA